MAPGFLSWLLGNLPARALDLLGGILDVVHFEFHGEAERDLVGLVSGLVVWEGVLVGVLLSRRSGTAWSMVCLRYIAGVLITISGGAGGVVPMV